MNGWLDCVSEAQTRLTHMWAALSKQQHRFKQNFNWSKWNKNDYFRCFHSHSQFQLQSLNFSNKYDSSWNQVHPYAFVLFLNASPQPAQTYIFKNTCYNHAHARIHIHMIIPITKENFWKKLFPGMHTLLKASCSTFCNRASIGSEVRAAE